MFCPFGKTPPLVHELLGRGWNIEAKLIGQKLDEALLVQDQRNVVDGGTVVNVDDLVRVGNFKTVLTVFLNLFDSRHPSFLKTNLEAPLATIDK